MKKLFTLLLAVVVLSAIVVPASAVTEDDLLEKFNELSISHYLKTEVENLAAAYDVTDEQAELLLDLIEEAKEIIPEDKGPGYANPDGHEDYFGPEKYPYTEEQLDGIMGIIIEACDIMGFTYDFSMSDELTHQGDVVLTLRDAEGRVAISYDGDVIKKLGEIEQEKSSLPYLVGGIALVALSAAALVVFKLKRKAQA